MRPSTKRRTRKTAWAACIVLALTVGFPILGGAGEFGEAASEDAAGGSPAFVVFDVPSNPVTGVIVLGAVLDDGVPF